MLPIILMVTGIGLFEELYLCILITLKLVLSMGSFIYEYYIEAIM